MNKPRISWLDWLLYFGSKDERHRQAADRGGHLAFWLAFAAATVDFFLRFDRGSVIDGQLWGAFQPVLADLVIIFGAGAWYGWAWISHGITISDSAGQRRMLRLLAWVCALVTVVVLLAKFWGDWSALNLVTIVLAGFAAYVVCRLVYWGLDRWASRRAERGAQGPDKPEY